MKLNKYMWLAAMPMLFAACQNDTLEESLQQQNGIYTLSGRMTGGAVMSRAQVEMGNADASKESFMWNEGDSFVLYQGTEGKVFTISSEYSETGDGDKKNATFTTETPAKGEMNYVAIYPSNVVLDGENVRLSLQRELDFTAAKTAEERAGVWKEYMKNNMFMVASGKLSSTEPNTVNFQHLCAMARITYTNMTDEVQKIDYIRLGSGQYLSTEQSYNVVGNYRSGGSSTSWYQISTLGLTVEAGASTDLYIMFFPSSFNMEGQFELAFNVFGREQYAKIAVADIAAANAEDAGFAAGKRYWFKLTGYDYGMVFSKDYTTESVTIENPELSLALLNRLGEDRVKLNEDSLAVMSLMDVRGITRLDFGWGDNRISSLKGIELFKNLTDLTCAYAGLKDCDLSQNTQLRSVSLSGNALTTLDLSKNVNLESLDLSENLELTSLNIDNCMHLFHLMLNETGLTSINIPNKEKIQTLGYGRTALSLNLNEFPHLYNLSVYGLGLTSLEFIPSEIKGQLYQLQCYDNKIEVIDLQEFPKMEYLSIQENSIKYLDVAPAPLLRGLYCHSCYLQNLDITSLENLERLDCGQQKDGLRLILKANDSQKDRWRNEWSTWYLNSNAYLEGEEPVEIPEGNGSLGNFGTGGEF